MMFTIRGIPTAGIAVGTAFVLQRRASAAATAAAGDPVAEAGRFHAALERAKAELSALAEGEAVFAAHLEMAGDPDARRAGRGEDCGKAPVRRAGARRSLRRGVRHVRGARRRLPAGTYRRCAGRMCAYRPHPVGRNRPRSLCRAGSGDDRGGRRAGAFGYGTDGFQQGRRIGDGARKRDEPCRDHRPEQGHRGAGSALPGACGRSEPATG